jgi:hypothetical protein
MKAVKYAGPYRVAVADVPEPQSGGEGNLAFPGEGCQARARSPASRACPRKGTGCRRPRRRQPVMTYVPPLPPVPAAS